MMGKEENMLKITGTFALFTGIIGLLFNWIKTCRQKGIKMRAFENLLTESIYRLKRENIRLCDFFDTVSTGDIEVDAGCKEIAEMLRQHQVSFVTEAWGKVWGIKLGEWKFGNKEKGIIQNIGALFMGGELAEIEDKARAQRGELEFARKKTMEEYEQKSKVFIPVVILCTLLLTIILI